MEVNRLLEASEALGWVSERMSALPEQEGEAVIAALTCTMAQAVLVEFAAHLTRGTEPYDALLMAARGTLPIDPAKATIFSLLSAKPATK